ncbi:Uncharacterized protein BP5553_10216 [Venustampulla echinocandica]|uniref:Dicer-like protein 1 n=1 Tax=Venustampulla echinocandica TaxID=2656787 RepID=A0A370T9J7_9HELO|nr:Uncharacterized protein BP5553_10216 [Venustampulla echinocandica]RDL30338.1 Uncharacterized protein BP5553_10216 [Venustampulla echinocandica]
MPIAGYLQHICLLADDCLLPIFDNNSVLIDNSILDPTSCIPELASGSLGDMMLLDETVILYEAHKAEIAGCSFTGPSTGPFTSADDTSSTPLLIDNPIELDTTSLAAPPATQAEQFFQTVAILREADILTGHQTGSATRELEIPKMTQDAPHANEVLVSTTALATRTTEDVIADLKRPTRNTHALTQKPEYETASVIPFEIPSEPNKLAASEHSPGDDDENLEHHYEDGDEDEEDNIQGERQPRKITERQRRLNVIADLYLQDKLRNPSADINKVAPGDEANQSKRWLVNQSESRQIISSPREYQVELFERAKEKNIIAVLDTGSGKTLIAVLLLRHIFAQELEDRVLGKPHRISFFLVDSVTLVYQQHAVLKANLDQPMNMFCGEMGCRLWNRKQWEKHFAENTVIVCTAEVLRQCLHHSFISMDRINLLIFDEAHHAKKDHAYARIIKDFYISAPSTTLLPKIFGMTASPVDARVDPKKAAAELEAILHCEIATAADPSVFQYSLTSKQEHLAKYHGLGPRFQTPLYKDMHARLKSNPVLRKPLLFAHEASRELGAWCADQMWQFCMAEEEVKKLLAKTESRFLKKAVSDPIALLEQNKSDLRKAQDIVKAHTFVPPDFDPKRSTSKNLSSKVMLLISYLRERFERPTDDKCIVFVKQRYTARLLAKLLSEPNIKTPNLFVGMLVGAGTGGAGDLNTTFRQQVITMMNFRKGILNCLFATSVAEEGLDVPECNLVIRFDLYDTLIQYIQSRGRARHANSRYIHMCEAGNQEHQHIIREVRINEGILKKFCNELPGDRKITGNDFDMDHFLAKERHHRVYTQAVTGAKLTYKMSLSVLGNFVDSLPPGPDNNPLAEYIVTIQSKQFICEVILPEGAPIRRAIGRPASTKQIAKCSAAFEMCLLLVKGKFLDEWLLPIYTKQLPAMRNALLAVDSKKRDSYDMRTKPALWSTCGFPEELFITVLSLGSPQSLDRPSQPLALLTRSKLPNLPSFILHFGAGKNSPVECISRTRPIKLSSANVNQINTFTLCIFDDVFSKEYESDPSNMPYFLAPLKPDVCLDDQTEPSDLIAWDILESVEQRQEWKDKQWELKLWQTEPDNFFNDLFIVDPWDGSRKLWCLGVNRQYKPLDPVPPNTAPRPGTRKRNDNIMEYSCSLWDKARARRTFDENQRVFEAELVPLRRNLLDELDSPDTEAPKRCFIVLESLKISGLPAKIVAMAYLFPAIIHRIEAYLIALEACDLLHLKISPDLALEAVTKDSDNSADNDAEQINFQRGMGNNYERLELLGDCFLKMATTISLYGIHPDNSEYLYHVDRMLLICNKNLCSNAIKLKLYEYIRSQSFSRRAWYPEGLVLKKGKTATAPRSHKLGDKTIADVCEAFIGAALLTHHETKNMDNAVRAVTEVVSSENHKLNAYADYYKLYKKPQYQIAQSTEVQRDMARQVEQKHSYHFQWPRLLRSAFVHPSYPYSYEHIPSYQRLEFLGDALLDMACVNFLFHRYPGKDPHWLTEHKMAMVSNAFLGCLCVSLGFHTHLLSFSASVQKQISDYVVEITEARSQAEDDAVRAGKGREEYSPDYWTAVRQPPKCLPDIVEAYVGAIFVDSEYNYSEVENFFDKHIRWYFVDMAIYDTYANKHPTTFLTNFLQVNMGCADWVVTVREIKSVDGSKPTIMAIVIIHEQTIAHAYAESGRYAKIAAAKNALNILKGLPLTEFRQKYCCSCRLGDAEEVAASDFHGTAV